MKVDKYLMESDVEALRLELKTDSSIVKKQAKWAGIQSGMAIADIGCGPGITTLALYETAQPNGRVVGIDFSQERITYATNNYKKPGISYICKDIRQPLDEIGLFDFVWVRFILEYYLSNSLEIVNNLVNILKPGGTLCLIDLDHNCLSHYGIPNRLQQTVNNIMLELQKKANFDPFAGRKLYSYLYDLNFNDIQVDISAHHNIYGELKKSDEFNFLKKVEIGPKKINYKFKQYKGGYKEFLAESAKSFRNPRRFTYTPIIMCRGKKPIQ
ncbi:MAG: class I SAM-dependent methyltransferase [Desulfobacteraceae bacterium]|nr:class I SAM-dependent methyltransferase [Desulfobacteraceae bacterium]